MSVFSADKNECYRQQSSGSSVPIRMNWLVLFHSRRLFLPSFPLLTMKGREGARDLLSRVENDCRKHRPLIMAMSTTYVLDSFHTVIITHLDTFAEPDHSRGDFSTRAAHQNHWGSFINMSMLRPHTAKARTKLSEKERIPTRMVTLWIHRNRDHGSQKTILFLSWESPAFSWAPRTGSMT